MYNSKYYTCEQIDQRLLEGYYDDAVAAGYTGSKSQYLAGLLQAINYSANPTITADKVAYNSASGLYKNVQEALGKIAKQTSKIKGVILSGDNLDSKKERSDIGLWFVHRTPDPGIVLVCYDFEKHYVQVKLSATRNVSVNETTHKPSIQYRKYIDNAWTEWAEIEFNILKTHILQADGITIQDTPLNNYIQHLKKTSTFAGIATPTTNPGTPDGFVFYLANQEGTYTNFNGIKLSLGESAILKYNNGTWEKILFPALDSYVNSDPSNMEDATTYVLTHNGENIKPMTTFDSVFNTDGKPLTDVVDSISSALSKPPLITSASHQSHYQTSGLTQFASLSLLDGFKKDDIINIEFKSIGEYNGAVRIRVFDNWIDIPASTDRERIFKTRFRMAADGIGNRIYLYSWNDNVDIDISITVFTKEDGYDNITTKSLEHENIIDLNIFENSAWIEGNRNPYTNYKCTYVDIQNGCKYKIQTTCENSSLDAITFVDKDNNVLGKIKTYGGSKELVVNGSNLPLPIGSAKILISCEKASDISVISVQSIFDYLKTKVDSFSLSSKASSDYFFALKGKKLGIIGDSISTYEGWVPDGYDVYYSNGGILPSVENTYWKIAANKLGMAVGNCSWSGSYVSGDSTSTSNANIGTSTKRINDLSADGINPDIVLVYMGTNDFLFGKDKGEFNMSSDYVDGNISTFMNAYALLLTKIRKAYPNCKILCGTMPLQFAYSQELYINNNWTSIRTKGESIPEWNDAIKEIAKAFGCGVVDFATCAINSYSSTLEDRCHPNIKGHKLMAERLIKDLLNC